MSELHATVSDVEFTLEWYRAFLERLRDVGYRFRSFEETGDADGIFLRHDVDLSVVDALEMARLESELGVDSTYLFLLTSPLYNPFEAEHRDRIREIADLGHDVGLHFNTHQYWPKNDPPDAARLVDRVLAEQSVMDVMLGMEVSETTSFHIPPEWVLGREFDGVRSTYAPAVFTDIGYVADSGQRWRDEPPDPEYLPTRCQVLTHPGLWGPDDAPFERRVEQAIEASVERTRREARDEFVRGVYS